MPPEQEMIPTIDQIARITPRATATTSATSLPTQVQSVVPSCAQSCLAAYLGQDYGCSSSDFDCYCDQYSSGGFALGELALICIDLDCTSTNTTEDTAAYNVCLDQTGAVLATHSTLTLPSTSFTSSSSTTSSSISIITASGSATALTTTATSLSAGASSSTTLAASTATAAASETTAASNATSITSQSGGSTMTSAQAVGVSIGAMAALVLAIAAVYFIAWWRNQRVRGDKKNRDSWDFVDDAPPHFMPFTYGYASRKARLAGDHKPPVEYPSEKHEPGWPDGHLELDGWPRDEKQPKRQSPSVLPASTTDRHSHSSTRTASRLLPLNAPNMRDQRPVPPVKSSRGDPSMPATVGQNDQSLRGPKAATTVLLPPPPAHQRQSYRPYRRAAAPQDAMLPAMQRPVQAAEHPRQPALSIRIPAQPSRVIHVASKNALPEPTAPNANDPYATAGEDNHSNRSPTSFLNYYAEPKTPEPLSSTPIDEDGQTRRPVPAAIIVTRPPYAQAAARLSTASDDTAFESTDGDEPTPPDEDEDKRLTPVAESPIASVRYPKVPRGSNQAVPRSPLTLVKYTMSSAPRPQNDRLLPPPTQVRRPTPLPAAAGPPRTPPGRAANQTPPSLSGTTLGPTRRDDRAALLQGFAKDPSATKITPRPPPPPPPPAAAAAVGQHPAPFRPLRLDLPPPPGKDGRNESPLKGYGRMTRNARPGEGRRARSELASPLWEPKLTPRRQGEDLYLAVSSATPIVPK